MDFRKHLLETATLIVAAVVCALTANAVASRERKLAVVPSAIERPAAKAPVLTTLPAATTAPQTTQQPDHPITKKPITDNRPPTTPPKAAREFSPHPDKPYIEIHYDAVAALHAAGALFLDARRTTVYEEGHIAGARPFSVWESDIDENVNKLFAERSDPRDQEKPIVVYCSGGDCEDSHMLAQKLWGIQFNNVYVYQDGFPDWQKHRGAIHTGNAP